MKRDGDLVHGPPVHLQRPHPPGDHGARLNGPALVPRHQPAAMFDAALRRQFRAEFLVGVEHQNPVAGDVFKRGVARGAEIVAPDKMMHFRAVRLRDFHRAVGRAGVHDNDLTGDGLDGSEALREKLLLIFDNQKNRQTRRGWRIENGGWFGPFKLRVAL